MADLRPFVTHEQVLTLLFRHFSTAVTGLVELDGGSVARTFAFEAGGQDYVIRFNLDRMLTSNFPKELYVWRRLAGTGIPMPPIIEVGRMDDLHFAISHKMVGKTLMQHTPTEVSQLLPQVIEILDNIHHVDVSATRGYGVFNYRGRGMAASWQDFLCRVAQEEDEKDYYGKWHHMFKDTFLERDVFERIYQQMLELLTFCPTDRFLVHGGISFNNMLAEDGKLTAILDWLDARYGDFVYDIAILDYWSPDFLIKDRFGQYYRERQIIVPDYERRILCYQCSVTLDAMRFYAKGGDERKYRAVRARIAQKLGWV